MDVENRVAILVDASVSSVAASLATMMAGAVYVPLDVTWPASRIRAILNDARPALLITDCDRP